MNYRTPFMATLVATGMLVTTASMSQDQSMPTTGNNTATYDSPQGPVTVNSKQGHTPSTASPPPFAQLSGGTDSITRAAAAAYPALLNDFKYADSNHDGQISKTEYEHWLSHLN